MPVEDTECKLAQMTDEAPTGVCVECEDQCAELECIKCENVYCRPCFAHLHRRGKRAMHATRLLLGEVMAHPTTLPEPSLASDGGMEASQDPESPRSFIGTSAAPPVVEEAASFAATAFADASAAAAAIAAEGGDRMSDDGTVMRSAGPQDEGVAASEAFSSSVLPLDGLGAAMVDDHEDAAVAASDASSSSEAEWEEDNDILMTQQPQSSSSSSSQPANSMASRRVKAAAAAKSRDATASSLRALASPAEAYRYVPLRLSGEERRLLALLQSALSVSEYTDKVDVLGHRWNRPTVVEEELGKMLQLLSGLCVAGDVSGGEKLVAGRRTVVSNAPFFQRVFEVGRRYKIMNPDKMRNYGKMMYMLQDSVAAKLGYSLVRDIETIYSFLAARSSNGGNNGLALLTDPRIADATHEVAGKGLTQNQVRALSQRKSVARAALMAEYGAGSSSGSSDGSGGAADDSGSSSNGTAAAALLTAEDVGRVLDSISDANNYLAHNVAPVERMLRHLEANFSRDRAEEPFSLRLSGGYKSTRSSSFDFSYSSYGSYSSFGRMSSSAKLCHDHATQFTFVQQSLSLWAEAMRSMFRLWYNADADLLSGRATYRMCNTGQGLQRVQNCPSVADEMRRVLSKVKSRCGPWVGLSVVHLGDRDVPNALVFIDKYAQIPRILTPIADTVDRIEHELCKDPAVAAYIKTCWNDPRVLKMDILSDFFKHGFDGDGDDGGSCIDGRLTSAWNWCSKIAKKPYYHCFMLSGFQGFDGDWRE